MEYRERNTNIEHRERDRGGRAAALVIGLIILLLLIAAIAYFAGWRDMNNDNDDQDLTPTVTPTVIDDTNSQLDNQPTPSPSPTANDADLSNVPQEVRDYITDTYPNFRIEDVDRETVDGQDGWKIELEHTTDEQNDVDLYYSADWDLVRTD